MARKRKEPITQATQPSESQPLDSSQSFQPSTKVTRTRGASLLKNFTKPIGEGKRFEIRFNKHGQPEGEHVSKLSTYVGTVAKRIVPITIESWKHVSDEDLNHIWDDVVDLFAIPEEHKSWVWKKANILWSTFKKELRRNHLQDKVSGAFLTSHPSIYDSYISQDEWKKFVQISQSNDFKEKREKYKQLSLMNDHTYRASKLGYKGVAERYKREHKLDASSSVSRAILYKEARKCKDGSYSDKSREVIDKIDMYLEQESTGELVTNGRKDVLALALGKQDHPGRVIGVGQDVHVSGFFGHASRHVSTLSTVNLAEAAVTEASKRLKESMRAEIESMFDEERQATKQLIQTLLDERKQYIPDKPLPDLPFFSTSITKDPVHKSGYASCSTIKDNTSPLNPNEKSHCQIFWPDLTKEVAKGFVYSNATVLHNQPLKSGEVKIEVVTVVQGQGEVDVPFITEEVHKLSDSVGQYIKWYDHLVKPIMGSPESLTEVNKGKSLTKESIIKPLDMDSVPSLVDDFRWMLEEFADGKTWDVQIPENLFNHKHIGFSMNAEPVQVMLDKKHIQMCHVSIYMRNHWVLLVLHPHKGVVYWIDSSHGEQREDAEQLVELSYAFKYCNLGKKKPRTQILWNVIKCPRQTTLIDCGYYVLRFMREIILRKSDTVPKIWYGRKSTYSDGEVDQIRKEWLEYLLQLVF